MGVTAAEVIRDYRIRHNLTIHQLAVKCDIGPALMSYLEAGAVTHPKIVERLQKIFDLTDEQTEGLLPKNRRPHDPDYDPDRYVDPKDFVNSIHIERKKKND